MGDDIMFNSKEELYKRVLPALYSKVKELNNLGYKNINEKDIWNYLAINEWKNRKNLELHDMISDILYLNNATINEYVTENLRILKEKEKQDIKDI